MKSLTQRAVLACTIALGVLMTAQPARAQGFISPLVGFNFGGDSGCPTVTNCEDKNLNLGVSFGVLGSIFGFEEEVAYAKDFFGEMPSVDSNVLTVMSNALIAPDLKVVRPYALAGIGLVKTHVELTQSSIFSADNNQFGWDVGGGLMIFLGPHVAVRGDIRYFHAVNSLETELFSDENESLNFGRAAAAVVFKF